MLWCEPISHDQVVALWTQGISMINGGCVRGYLASPVKPFWNQEGGVRRAGDDFFFPMIREKPLELYLDQ
jgi:hypothetical protein